MPRLLPAIAATSVAAVLLSLSACSNAAPTDPASSAQQSMPREPKTSRIDHELPVGPRHPRIPRLLLAPPAKGTDRFRPRRS